MTGERGTKTKKTRTQQATVRQEERVSLLKQSHQQRLSESATPCEVSGDTEEVLVSGTPRSQPLSVCGSRANIQSEGVIYYTYTLI